MQSFRTRFVGFNSQKAQSHKMVNRETTPDLKLWWYRQLVRKISLLVQNNLKSPPFALLHPTASTRAKEKQTVEFAYNGQQKG